MKLLLKLKLYSTSTVYFSILIFSASANATTAMISTDNDGVLLMDREYTGGFFIRLGDKKDQYAYSIELGSQIWTPKNIKFFNPQPDQRPYAGLLYIQGKLHYITQENALKTSLLLGTVGPNSYAEQLQTFIHKYISSPTPNG